MKVVLNDKPASDQFMIGFGFGKGQRFTHKTADALTKRTVPAFLVRSLSSFLADTVMRAGREDSRIGLPEIAVRTTAAVSTRNGLPQPTATLSTAVAKHEGDNLTGSAAQDCPQPDGIVLASNKSPQLIDFQHVPALLRQQTIREAWQTLHVRLNPVHCCLAGHPVNAGQPAQTGSLRVAAQHILAALPLIIWFWLQHAVRPIVFAVVLRLSDLVRPVLNDILAATYPAFVRLCHLDHAAYSGLSLTIFPQPEIPLTLALPPVKRGREKDKL